MKKILFLILIVLSITFITHGQWSSDVRLTNNPAFSFLDQGKHIATFGDFVHIVWYDQRDGNYEVYYKSSTNKGLNWSGDLRLTNNSAASYKPTITVSGSAVHVVWYDSRDGNDEIYYKRSTNNGVSWDADIRLTNNSSSSVLPSVASFGQNVHVVWHDDRDGNYEIYYKRSINGGVSWENDTRLTNSPRTSDEASLSVSASEVNVVWTDERDGLYGEIYYKRSTDGGLSWESDNRLTNNIAVSSAPSISIAGQFVHVVWHDNRDTFWDTEIWYKCSTDRGFSWGTDIRLTTYLGNSWFPQIVSFDSIVHIVWQDNRDGNDEVYYKRSIDHGVSWEIDIRITNYFERSKFPSISLLDSAIHIVWEDYRDGNAEVYYKHNLTGIILSLQNSNSEIPTSYMMYQNYPNPFNPNTKIKFQIPKSGQVNLEVFDALGRNISTLVNESLNAGVYEVDWNAINNPSGIYFYKITTSEFAEVKKMVLIK